MSATTSAETELARSPERPEAPGGRNRNALPAAMAAHDLRNALQSAQAASDLLGLVATGAAAREAVDILGEALSRMAYLVDTLSRGSFSSRPAGRPVTTADLGPTLAASLRSYPDVRLDLPAGLSAACAPEDLQRIVVNLVANATAHGAPPVEVRGRPRCGLVELTVTDQGQGVDPEFAAALFEPFSRYREHRPGSGLGLAIVRQLCAANGGSVTFLPRPRGACFRVLLPSVT